MVNVEQMSTAVEQLMNRRLVEQLENKRLVKSMRLLQQMES